MREGESKKNLERKDKEDKKKEKQIGKKNVLILCAVNPFTS